MELYPLIEPFVNFTKDRFYNFSSGSVKVAKDLHYFVRNGGKKRVLVAETQSNDPANSNASGDPKTKDGEPKTEGAEVSELATKKNTKADGADGDVISEEADGKITGDYPAKLFSDTTIQNGGFMVYLFCKYNLKFLVDPFYHIYSHLIRIYWYCIGHTRLHQPSY